MLKKCIFVWVIILVAVMPASAEGIISRDFYLNNREFAVFRERVSILPNTLRLEVTEGESATLRAEVMPRAELSEKLSWRNSKNSGAVTIYPSGGSCTVHGNFPGEETVEISLDGDFAVSVAVTVKRAEQIKLRSFEVEKQAREPIFTARLLSWIVRGLVVMAAVFLATSLVLFFKRKGRGQ